MPQTSVSMKFTRGVQNSGTMWRPVRPCRPIASNGAGYTRDANNHFASRFASRMSLPEALQKQYVAFLGTQRDGWDAKKHTHSSQRIV